MTPEFTVTTQTRALDHLRWKFSQLSRKVLSVRSRPISPASLAVFRIVFGVLGVAAAIRFVAMGWVSELYIEPAHHFTYYGFGWVKPWPGWGMYFHFALMGLASLGVALGYRYRLSVIAFFLLFTYVELIDRTTYLNHYYFISLISFLMIFLPLNRTLSFDAARGKVRKDSPTAPLAAIWILRTQIGLVYLFAGIAKLNPDWLFNAEPLRIWLFNNTDAPLLGPLLREAWVPYAMSWAGACFDLTIIVWLLWKRTRPYAYVVLVTFHLMTALFFPSIGMFPWIMIGATLIFFDPDWPQRLLQRFKRPLKSKVEPVFETPDPAQGKHISWPVRTALGLAAAFLALQVLFPLRHLAYPGNVQWTEEGYPFSWRVMVTEKTGQVKYRVASSDFQGERLILPEEYLTPLQVERMAYQPDMILATAHLIRDDFITRGQQEIEVRADAFVTFNGRTAARLIDPNVDLARVSPGIGHKPWILKAPT